MSLDVLLAAGVVAAAWCGHTSESLALSHQVVRALKAIGYDSQQAVSIDMGLDKDGTKLSRQIAGVEPINLWRLAKLPGFTIAFASIILADAGRTVITAEDRALILGFVGIGAKRMARVFPKLASERQSA